MTLATRPFRVDRNLRLIYVFGLLTGLQPGIALWVIYLLDFRHLTLAQVGIMEAFFWGVKVLLEVPAGAIADRFGRRAAFALGLVIEAGGIATFAFASNYPVLLLSYVLWSGGFSFRSGNDRAYLYDALAVEDRGAEFSTRSGTYQAAWTSALMISGIGGGWLAARTTLQVPLALGVIPYVIAIGVVAVMQEPPRTTTTLGRLGYAQTLRAAIAALRRAPAVRMILCFEITLTAAFVAHMLLLQPFMQQHGVSLALFGVMQIPVHLASALGSVASTRAMQLAGIRRLAGIALIVTVGGLVLLAIVDHVAAFAGFVAMELAVCLVVPAIGGYVNDRTDASIRATIMSVTPLGTAIVFALMGPIVGIVGGASLQLAFSGMAIAILLAAGASLLLWRAAEREAVIEGAP